MFSFALYFLLVIFGITLVYSKGRKVFALFGDCLWQCSYFTARFRFIYATL